MKDACLVHFGPVKSLPVAFRRDVLNGLIVLYLLMIAGGLYTTVTHRSVPVLTAFTDFAYGMLAPYQFDNPVNVDLAVVAWDKEGRSVLLSVASYFPGQLLGERNSRMRLEKLPDQSLPSMAAAYQKILRQILERERSAGHEYIRLDLSWEEWPRSPLGYDALRMTSVRHFITSVSL